MSLPTTPEEGLRFLSSLTRSGIRMGLDPIRTALAAVQNPERNFPSLHVAGTNGKGSTCAFAATCLIRGGYRVGLYTSPHLVRVNERIQVGGREISDRELGQRILDVLRRYPEAANEPHPLTYFEFLTLVGLWHFSEQHVDVAVLETGLGGRLDATNTARSIVTAITPISFDHMEYLGNSLEQIAGEKAGILKPDVPAVLSRQPSVVRPVLEARAKELGAPVYLEGRDFSLEVERSKPEPVLTYRGPHQVLDGLTLSLRGRHQIQNASVALACLEAMGQQGFRLSPAVIQAALSHTQWPGRFEQIDSAPVVLLDAAHNPAGIEVLCSALDDFFPDRPVHAVFGVLADKDVEGMLRRLLPRCQSAHLTGLPTSRSLAPESYLTQARSLCSDTNISPSPEDALAAARKRSRPSDVVVCTGSLFLVGAIEALVAAKSKRR